MIYRLVTILIFSFLSVACGATKEKCFFVEMLATESRMNFVAPSTGFMAIGLGSIHLEGENRYRSCPGDATQPWMTNEPDDEVPVT